MVRISRTGTKTRPEARRRTAAPDVRRRQLIAATIDSIAKRGFAATTLAFVAARARLSRGIVNFHFQSKEALLVATLEHLAEEYRAHWRRALERAGPSTIERLGALVDADFERRVCNRKKIAVWFAFWGEARSRPTYLEVCGRLDRDYFAMLRDLCAAAAADGGYPRVDPDRVASALCALTDGLWLSYLLAPESFDRAEARAVCYDYLAAVFPRHVRAGAVVVTGDDEPAGRSAGDAGSTLPPRP